MPLLSGVLCVREGSRHESNRVTPEKARSSLSVPAALSLEVPGILSSSPLGMNEARQKHLKTVMYPVAHSDEGFFPAIVSLLHLPS